MPDYGHPLRFGTFVIPRNVPADAPVALAESSERLGFDLVTFQDHPYQPAFHDTWTLLSFVAARTERIRLSANVMNLGIRDPAIMARSAASLDLLSHGRFELGAGAGGFWDAIHAMGGRKLSPGQAVDAFSEAIDVIRGIWDVADRRPLRVDGAYHRLSGAKRGPAPAHEIPILIGAVRPRMLRLTARKGDGWLPSLPVVGLDGFRDGNRLIDETATAHGRDPREIVRMLNAPGEFAKQRRGFLHGPPSAWVDDLLPLILEDGLSTVIVTGDPDVMETFMGEVAPALRTATAEARGRAPASDGG